jgi:hypothetical protein
VEKSAVGSCWDQEMSVGNADSSPLIQRRNEGQASSCPLLVSQYGTLV